MGGEKCLEPCYEGFVVGKSWRAHIRSRCTRFRIEFECPTEQVKSWGRRLQSPFERGNMNHFDWRTHKRPQCRGSSIMFETEYCSIHLYPHVKVEDLIMDAEFSDFMTEKFVEMEGGV